MKSHEDRMRDRIFRAALNVGVNASDGPEVLNDLGITIDDFWNAFHGRESFAAIFDSTDMIMAVRQVGIDKMRLMSDAELLQIDNFGKKAIAMFRSMYPIGYRGEMRVDASFNFQCPA